MLSIILPIYNEEENIEKLYREIKEVLANLGLSYEIIAVNDASEDKSPEILRKIAGQDRNFKVINFRRNSGQTAAISAGMDFSQGDIIILMDADLQNDPADIPRFIEAINQGFDFVSGWRKNRKDSFSKRITSKVGNFIIPFITKVKLHDYVCGMKAYKKEVLDDLRLYGEMHRFIPAYIALQGYKIKEIEVSHRPRKSGKTKYGFSRIFKAILDLLLVKFLMTYLNRPIHFFGQAGLMSFFLGFLAGVAAIILKIDGTNFNRTPLPLLTIFLTLVGIQFILMGILAEIMIRIYYEPYRKSPYLVKDKINFEERK